MTSKFLAEYSEFVKNLMNKDVKGSSRFNQRIKNLQDNNDNLCISTLTIAALGLSGEAGEVTDIVKKIIGHGEDITPNKRDELIKEIGDVIWYVTALCQALDIPLEEVIEINMDKLNKRHPGGSFSKGYSELPNED